MAKLESNDQDFVVTRMNMNVVCKNRILSFYDVWDQGKGISDQHHDFVFERMYTLEDSRNKLFQGSGLGLTITKRLVEQLGGEIHLHSKPFEKTIFTVKLPRATY